MSEHINSAFLGTSNERILLLQIFNIMEYIQANFIERTGNAIPCLSSIHIRALINISIPTNAQVLKYTFNYTSLILRHVSILLHNSGSFTSNKHVWYMWITELLNKSRTYVFACDCWCKTRLRWFEDNKKMLQ
jgi:hypothetical protein